MKLQVGKRALQKELPTEGMMMEGWSQEPCRGRAIHSQALFFVCLTHVFP